MFNRSEAEQFVAEQKPIELALARQTAARSLIVGPLLVAAAFIWRGTEGAIAAFWAVLIVVGYYLLTGWILSKAARISFSVYYAGALFGFLIRLGLIMATMYLVAAVTPVDRLVLGLSVVVAYLALLLWEVAVLAKN